ncbi:hypothetical protein BAPA111461_26780 [Bacillus paramycoides]
MYLFHYVGIDFLTRLSHLQHTYFKDTRYMEIEGYRVSYKTMEIFQLAKCKMERFNQVYVNEGHIDEKGATCFTGQVCPKPETIYS